jgi:hypothetical protein
VKKEKKMQLNNNLISLPKLDTLKPMAAPNGADAKSAKSAKSSGSSPAAILNISSPSGVLTGLTVRTFLAQLPSISQASPVNIVDSAVNIAKNLDALNDARAKIGSIAQSGPSPLNLVINYSQYNKDKTIGAGSILSKLGAGSNNVQVSGVDDLNLTTLENDSKVVGIGVINVDASVAGRLANRLDLTSHSKISTVGIKNVTVDQLTNSANALYASVNSAKVSSIGVINVASASLNSILRNGKVTSATVTGVAATSVASVGAKTQVTSMTVADLSSNLAASFGNLIGYQNKISSVTQTDSGGLATMTLSGAQYKSASTAPAGGGSSLFSKFSDQGYTVTLNNVLAADVSSLYGQSPVLSMNVVDSGLNLGQNFDSLTNANNLTKITSIKTLVPNSAVSISKSQYDTGMAANGALSKFTGPYYLSISGAALSDVTGVTTLTSNSFVKAVGLVGVAAGDVGTAAANTLVKSIQVSDTASHVMSAQNLSSFVANLGKITQISNSANTRDEVSFSSANYNAALVDKFSGFSTAVAFSGSASQYRVAISTDAKGNRGVTITPNPGANGEISKAYQNNINFFKFSDKNLFGTTGNKNVDAILLGGTKQWWSSSTAATPAIDSNSQIAGPMYALTSNSSKHALTYSFLTSNTIASASNPGGKDAVGFAEMNQTEKTAVQNALDYISSVTNLTFSVAQSGLGDINFGTNNQGTASGAYAYNPNTADHIDVMLNNNAAVFGGNGNFSQGTYGWETLIHEIGHALGLKHPGNYNAGGGGTVGPYLPTGDVGSRRYTIMSYSDPADAKNVTDLGGGSYSYGGVLNPSTFMVYDLAALQFLYGVNTDAAIASPLTNASSVNNFQKTSGFTDGWRGFETLYEPASQNTSLNLSGITSDQNIVDLRAGAFSSINVLPASAKSGLPPQIQSNQTYFGFNNVALAYGSQIDSITGGGASDTYFAGDQSITITDNGGSNKVYLSGSSSDWTYDSGAGTYTKGSQTVTLAGSGTYAVAYYNASTTAMTHSALDLVA